MKIASALRSHIAIKQYVTDIDQDQEPLLVNGVDTISVEVMSLATYNSYS